MEQIKLGLTELSILGKLSTEIRSEYMKNTNNLNSAIQRFLSNHSDDIKKADDYCKDSNDDYKVWNVAYNKALNIVDAYKQVEPIAKVFACLYVIEYNKPLK